MDDKGERSHALDNLILQLPMSPQDRLSAIASHTSSRVSMSSERPFITCHVLDTVSGKPAPGIAVSLTLLAPSTDAGTNWTAATNSDGRVTAWQASDTTLNDQVANIKQSSSTGDQMMWKLTFDTENYFGKGNTFWPEVELKFAAKMDEEHYHVPLLLGPWSYTTYRGS